MRDRGSATTVALALSCVIIACTLTLTLIALVLVAGERARTAADFAALAAARDVTGQPCIAAEEIAQRNHAHLVECSADGADVHVAARVDLPERAGVLRGLLPRYVIQYAHAGTA